MHRLRIILVPVPRYSGTVVPFGTISLVLSILASLDRGERTVLKNVNHCKCEKNQIPKLSKLCM
jgi:hypothetical protein